MELNFPLKLVNAGCLLAKLRVALNHVGFFRLQAAFKPVYFRTFKSDLFLERALRLRALFMELNFILQFFNTKCLLTELWITLNQLGFFRLQNELKRVYFRTFKSDLFLELALSLF